MPEPVEPHLDELRRRARRRLIGAVVLALAAAVVVPMLLESEPRPLGDSVSVRIPPIDDGKFVNRIGPESSSPEAAALPSRAITPLPDVAPKAVPSESPAPSEAPAAATPAPRKSLAQAEQAVLSPGMKTKPADAPPTSAAPVKDAVIATAPASGSGVPAPAKSSTESAAAETSKPVASAAKPSNGGFSVQLGAFSDDKGANALAGRLKKAGHPAYTEPFETARGTVWRVRVGPFATRDAAEASRSRLKADGQNGIIAAAK